LDCTADAAARLKRLAHTDDVRPRFRQRDRAGDVAGMNVGNVKASFDNFGFHLPFPAIGLSSFPFIFFVSCSRYIT